MTSAAKQTAFEKSLDALEKMVRLWESSGTSKVKALDDVILVNSTSVSEGGFETKALQ